MKRIFSLMILVMAISSALIAQQVPQGMKYQAVARNLKGEILADEKIVLKISLTSQEGKSAVVHYSELHNVKTNELGLFTLVIGEGVSNKKTFKEIPWSSQNIWMEVAIADKDKGGFTVISSSKLLAVPYAFHAETANKISGNINFKEITGTSGGTTSGNSWNTVGNLKTNPLTDYLGTADNVDLVIKTNAIERMRISNTGTTSFSGILKVSDATQSTAPDNGALVVTGGAGIGKNLNVGGNLNVAGDVAVNTNKFNIAAATGNTSIAGDVSVNTDKFNITAANGNTSIAGDVSINTNKFNIASATGNTSLAGNFSINTNKFNVTSSNGNTSIAGTLGVANDFSVNANKFNIAALSGNTTIAGTLGVANNFSINSNKFTIEALSGNTGIAGTLGVAGITTLNNSVFANGQVRISVFLPQFADNVYANYPLQVEGSKQGIAIKLNSAPFSNPTENNNFISFLNSSGGFRGRIEGHPALIGSLENSIQTLVDNLTLSFTGAFALSNATSSDAQEPVDAAQIFTSNAAIESYERLLDFLTSVVRFATNVIGASGLCVSGDCDDVIWSAVDMGVDLGKLGIFIWLDNEQAGVSYESGGADYAEWLPKLEPHESLSYGDVVGVKGGVISKNFKEADKFMVVSFAPVVIGGMPEADKENSYEKIAFMGQVVVKVMGVVKKNDYILPSGNGDGFAIAISPDKMKALDYQRVIGVSWDESDGKEIFKFIKTAVGINTNDMAGMIDNMQAVMNKMQEAIKKLSPDYVPSFYSVNGSFAQTKSGYSTMPTINDQLKTKVGNIEKGETFTAKLKEVNNALKEQGIDFSKYKMIENCLNHPTKENAELLANRANLLLSQYQAIFASVQKQKLTK